MFKSGSMKMTPGSGTITNYASYTNNCTAGQLPYKIPVNNLSDVQLYINIGTVKPETVTYELINTCGGGGVETIIPVSYVVAQDSNAMWYGVFKNFSGATPVCFVIGITLTFAGESGEQIYFSEEYCVENNSCNSPLTILKGCYGHLDSKISYDCEGVFFGTGTGEAMGDTTVTYQHQLLLRKVEVTLSAIKNTFKQGRTRNFRTEKEKIYQFWGERVPEWYLSEIDAVFYRGEVYIGSKRYMVNETAYELIEECSKQWMPAATFKESCYQSFSCEADPCAALPVECCDPEIVSVVVSEVAEESGFQSGIVVIECFVDSPPVVTGTTDPVTGIVGGSFTIYCDAFVGVRVFVTRGYIEVPGIPTLDGSAYYTKVIADNFITMSHVMVPGEFIYTRTIP